jgi:hypothetical protein
LRIRQQLKWIEEKLDRGKGERREKLNGGHNEIESTNALASAKCESEEKSDHFLANTKKNLTRGYHE